MTRPTHCPDPLCILDITYPSPCDHCPKVHKLHSNCPSGCEYSNHCQNDPQAADYCPRPRKGWGGKRENAGAPVGNLNRLVHGGQSRLVKKGIEKLAEDPDLRAILYLIGRLAVNGIVPASTRRLITKIIERR